MKKLLPRESHKLEKHFVKLECPDEISITFNSLFGLENEKIVLMDIVNYFTNKEKFNGSNILPHIGYIVSGPVGSGKMSLVYSIAKASNVPVISFETNIFNVESESDVANKLDLIFESAKKAEKKCGGCLIAFKNFDAIDDAENFQHFFNIFSQHMENLKNTFIFLLSSEPALDVPAIIMEKPDFYKTIVINMPNQAVREQLFKHYIATFKVKIAKDVDISRLAKDTIGDTAVTISYIVKEAFLFSMRQGHTEITSEDFAEVIMTESSGDKHLKMTDKERTLTAYHEAGHVIAGYFSNPSYVLKRVEISPRNQGSLGLTATDVDETKYSYFKEDYEYLIIEFLGGLCAEEIKFNSHTSGVAADLISATAIANAMVTSFGMSEELGTLAIIKNLSSSVYAEALSTIAVQNMLEDLLNRTYTILNEHISYLEALVAALLENEVIIGSEIKTIFDAVTIEANK